MDNLEKQLIHFCDSGEVDKILQELNSPVSLPSNSPALPLVNKLVAAMEKDIDTSEVKDEILVFLDNLWKSSDEVEVSYRMLLTKNYQFQQICFALALLYFTYLYNGSEDLENVINQITKQAHSIIVDADSFYLKMLQNGTLPTVAQAKERDILANLQWQSVICLMYEGRWYSDIREQIHSYSAQDFMEAAIYEIDAFCIPLARSIENIQ